MATCLASALATLLMGLLANYPVALAPAMGHNFFFVFTVCGAMGFSWQAGMGANFVAGVLFLLITICNLQGRLIAAIPVSLRHGIAVGIGLYIAFIGLTMAGIVADDPGTLIALGDLGSRPVLVSLAVFVITGGLLASRVRGAILFGILSGVLLAVPLGVAEFHGVCSAPPSLAPTFLQLDLQAALTSSDLLVVIFIFLFLDVFDTMGTLIGVATQGGFMRAGKLPRARQAFLSDAIGTLGGACLGTTTVTSYIESAAGIAAGGRTGLTALVTAGCFLLAMFFYPLIRTVGEGYQLAETVTLYPLTAPALVFIGFMMMRSATKIVWDDLHEALPAFLMLVMIPFTLSIPDGFTFGFLAYSLLALVSGRIRHGDPLLHGISVLLLLRWIFC